MATVFVQNPNNREEWAEVDCTEECVNVTDTPLGATGIAATQESDALRFYLAKGWEVVADPEAPAPKAKAKAKEPAEG